MNRETIKDVIGVVALFAAIWLVLIMT